MGKAASGPQRTIIFYSRITIWLALLFIAGGMAVQSLQVNLVTQSDVDRAFANAMAEQMSHALNIRLQDTRRLQQAASNHPQTLQALREDNPAWRATRSSTDCARASAWSSSSTKRTGRPITTEAISRPANFGYATRITPRRVSK